MTSAPIRGTLDYPATAWKSLASATAGERRSIPKWATLQPAYQLRQEAGQGFVIACEQEPDVASVFVNL